MFGAVPGPPVGVRDRCDRWEVAGPATATEGRTADRVVAASAPHRAPRCPVAPDDQVGQIRHRPSPRRDRLAAPRRLAFDLAATLEDDRGLPVGGRTDAPRGDDHVVRPGGSGCPPGAPDAARVGAFPPHDRPALRGHTRVRPGGHPCRRRLLALGVPVVAQETWLEPAQRRTGEARPVGTGHPLGDRDRRPSGAPRRERNDRGQAARPPVPSDRLADRTGDGPRPPRPRRDGPGAGWPVPDRRRQARGRRPEWGFPRHTVGTKHPTARITRLMGAVGPSVRGDVGTISGTRGTAGGSAYLLWGGLTVYWKQLSEFDAFELIAWRMLCAPS